MLIVSASPAPATGVEVAALILYAASGPAETVMLTVEPPGLLSLTDPLLMCGEAVCAS